MNATHKKLEEILKREQNPPQDIKNLYKRLYDNIHGNTNINTVATKELINKLILETELNGSKVINIEVKESPYNSNKNKELDTQYLYITLTINGKYNGKIYFETNAGTKRDSGSPIYYIYSHKNPHKSDLEEKIMNYYKNTYPRLLEELFLDIAIDKAKYLNLDTIYNKYELWDCSPGSYEDTMTGKYFDNDKPINSLYKYEALGKVYQHKSIRDFGDKSDWSNWTTETVEWRNYYI